VRAENVKKITAKVGEFTVKMLCYPIERKLRPQTHVDAQFSLPYAVAVAICKNRTGIQEFSAEALRDPDVLALAERVAWELDPEAEKMYPKAYPATLIAELKDGRVLRAQVEYPKGDPENPASDEEIIAKFNSLTEPYFDKTRREKIIATVNHLEEITNIAQLADLVR
jgi:2-methylcitrate dehydratase PrpD